MSRSRTRTPRRLTAAVAGVAVCLTTTAVAPAVAVSDLAVSDVDVDSWVDLAVGDEGWTTYPYLTDGKVYLLEEPPGAGTPSGLYERDLVVVGGEALVGPPEEAGLAAAGTRLAVHEGSVAYTRGDDRLVIRDADGLEDLPDWGTHPAFARGVWKMTDDWVVAGRLQDAYWLFDRQTGAAYDLSQLVTVPDGYDWSGTWVTALSDDRLILDSYDLGSSASASWHSAVHTVALGDTGPVGEAELLAEVFAADAGDATHIEGLMVDGDRVVWVSDRGCDLDACWTTVSWRDGAPYSGEADGTARLDGSAWPMTDGGQVIWFEDGDGVTTARWLELGTPLTTVKTRTLADAAGYFDRIVGSFAILDEYEAWPRVTYLDGPIAEGVPEPEPQPESPFSDVTPTDVFGVEILALHDAGIIGGYPDGTFRNIASVNRDAMAAFMYRMVHPGADKPVCSTAAFVDVPASHPFCGEIAWLAETGVTTGWPDGTFRPSAPVTREAMAAFMYRLASGESTALECQAAPFVDVSTGHPFCGAIRWMAEENISKGWPNGTFLPGDNVQRQAMAAFLYRFMLGGFVPESVG